MILASSFQILTLATINNSRRISIGVLLIALTSCGLLPPNDSRLSQQMSSSLEDNNLREAYDAYEKLSTEQKQSDSTQKLYKQLKTNIALTRDRIEKLANEAIQKDDWKLASELYNAQSPLIAIDEAFQKNYQTFLSKMSIRKEPIQNEFLIVKAEYLIKKRKMERAIAKLDPFDANNELQLEETKRESKAISKLLLSQGLEAFHNDDITTARKLIPLAKALYNNKTARKATRVLEKSVRPMADYITKLTDYGTQLYGTENYQNALEIWDTILYLDPNNEKIIANKERTLKVLESLEKIKQDSELTE